MIARTAVDVGAKARTMGRMKKFLAFAAPLTALALVFCGPADRVGNQVGDMLVDAGMRMRDAGVVTGAPIGVSWHEYELECQTVDEFTTQKFVEIDDPAIVPDRVVYAELFICRGENVFCEARRFDGELRRGTVELPQNGCNVYEDPDFPELNVRWRLVLAIRD